MKLWVVFSRSGGRAGCPAFRPENSLKTLELNCMIDFSKQSKAQRQKIIFSLEFLFFENFQIAAF
jgi:hypothetical protein